MIDYGQYFLKENEEQQKGERRVGLGTMGLGTLMILMKIRYGSEEGLKFIDKLYKFIAVEAYKASIDLAIEKGPFPKCDPEKMAQSGFMKRLLPELPKEYQEKFFKYGIRNVTLLTQAPTGSTGTYIDNLFQQYGLGCTTGIEPYFAFEYWRASRSGFAKQEVKLVKEWREANPDATDLPDYFVTAQDLNPEDHIRVQAAIQKWTDSSISKTANCPNHYTVEDVKKLYNLAYELGLKGVTVYRDGSREAQVLATEKEKAKLESDLEEEKLKKMKGEEKKEYKINVHIKKDGDKGFDEIAKEIVDIYNSKKQFQKRPRRLYGFTEKVTFTYGDNVGKAYITVNLGEDGRPWEVFIATKEKEVSSLAKALGLMTTKLLRLGCAEDTVDQAIDTLAYDQVMGSLPYHVSRILKEVEKERLEKLQQKTGETHFQECPSCGAKAFDKVNCVCHACGQSKCN